MVMAKKVLSDKGAPKSLPFRQRIRTNFGIAVLKVMSSLPEFFRRTAFSLLTDKWKKVLRTPDFVDSRTPVVDIDSNDPVLAEAIRNWERILLMPREELRLRANI